MDEEVRARRIAVVQEHMEAENRHDFDAVIATFERPRYELMALDQVHDGEEAVRAYFAGSRHLFPDQRNTNAVLHTGDGDLVVAELDLLGTHHETGRSFRTRMAALFFFEGEGIVCERVYFDPAPMLATFPG